MKKTLYLMRHGETLFNLQGKKQGWCDSPLTERGRAQATIAKAYFEEKDIRFTAAFSSTSERACDTLEIITDCPYQRVKELKEWHFGSLEGEHEYLNPPLPYGDYFIQFGGEGEAAFHERFTSAVRALVEKTESDTILIVAHGAACAQFMRGRFIKNHDTSYEQSRGMKNCSIVKFEIDEGAFTFVEKISHDFSVLDSLSDEDKR
mgnify:CR=1 FL=1